MANQASRRAGTFLLIVGGTVIAIAGTDLLLPAIPGLPQTLGGSLAEAQLVLASFTAGSALGLILYGELGASLRSALASCRIAIGVLACLVALHVQQHTV